MARGVRVLSFPGPFYYGPGFGLFFPVYYDVNLGKVFERHPNDIGSGFFREVSQVDCVSLVYFFY